MLTCRLVTAGAHAAGRVGKVAVQQLPAFKRGSGRNPVDGGQNRVHLQLIGGNITGTHTRRCWRLRPTSPWSWVRRELSLVQTAGFTAVPMTLPAMLPVVDGGLNSGLFLLGRHQPGNETGRIVGTVLICKPVLSR